MIDIIFALQMAKLQQEAEERCRKQWQEDFEKADPEMKKWMIEKREKDRLEAIEERRHRENIRAQERIADAIRASSFWRF
jgi:hypothetical protein